MSYFETLQAAHRERQAKFYGSKTAKIVKFPDKTITTVVKEEHPEPVKVPIKEGVSPERLAEIEAQIRQLHAELRAAKKDGAAESPPAKIITVKEIIKAVSKYYNVPLNHMLSARRLALIVRPRHVAMYLAKELTIQTYPAIGRAFGGRDHTTVMNALVKITHLRTIDPELDQQLVELTAIIEGPSNV